MHAHAAQPDAVSHRWLRKALGASMHAATRNQTSNNINHRITAAASAGAPVREGRWGSGWRGRASRRARGGEPTRAAARRNQRGIMVSSVVGTSLGLEAAWQRQHSGTGTLAYFGCVQEQSGPPARSSPCGRYWSSCSIRSCAAMPCMMASSEQPAAWQQDPRAERLGGGAGGGAGGGCSWPGDARVPEVGSGAWIADPSHLEVAASGWGAAQCAGWFRALAGMIVRRCLLVVRLQIVVRSVGMRGEGQTIPPFACAQPRVAKMRSFHSGPCYIPAHSITEHRMLLAPGPPYTSLRALGQARAMLRGSTTAQGGLSAALATLAGQGSQMGPGAALRVYAATEVSAADPTNTGGGQRAPPSPSHSRPICAISALDRPQRLAAAWSASRRAAAPPLAPCLRAHLPACTRLCLPTSPADAVHGPA